MAPRRRAVRATSIATLPPPTTTTLLAQVDFSPLAAASRNGSAASTCGMSAPGIGSGRLPCRPAVDHYGVVGLAKLVERDVAAHTHAGLGLDAERQDVSRCPCPARCRAGGSWGCRSAASRRAAASPRSMVTWKPRIARSYATVSPAGPPPTTATALRSAVTGCSAGYAPKSAADALERGDRDRVVEFAAPAAVLARAQADATAHGRQRVALEDDLERVGVAALGDRREVARARRCGPGTSRGMARYTRTELEASRRSTRSLQVALILVTAIRVMTGT